MAEAGTDCAQDSTESSIVIFDVSSDKRLFMDGNFRIILKYLKGDATPDERLQVMEWVRQSDANRKELETLRRIYDIILISEDDGRKSAGKGFRRILLWAGSVAAAAAVALGVWLSGNGSTEDIRPLAIASLESPSGHQSLTVLNDGTRIRLNAGSRFEIIPGNEAERHVRLDGEAFFDVARDELRPFVLETSGMEVKVLGTSFNVTAYDEIQSVVLVEGCVEVKGSGEETSTRISPSQRFIYDTVSNTSGVEETNPEEYTSWIDGYLLLANTPVPEILARIGHYYGVEVACTENDFAGETVSGKLMLGEGMDTVLQTLSLMVPMKYEYVGEDSIAVRKK